MKIRIRPKGSWFRITLHLPLCMVKTRFVARVIAESLNENATPQEVQTYHVRINEAYSALKRYIKRNGHFNLVDIRSNEGSVFIRL